LTLSLYLSGGGSLLLISTTPTWIWFSRILTQLRLCLHWTSPKAISILCRKPVEYSPRDTWLLASSRHELGLSTLADRKVGSNLNFLRNLIDGSADAPTLLSLINFCVPPRRSRSTTTFPTPMRVKNYSSNNLIHSMLHFTIY